MKALIFLAVIMSGSFSMAMDLCRDEAEAEILHAHRGRMRNSPELKYQGPKVSVYSARIENNGGEMQVEAVLENETCRLVHSYIVWSD